LGKTFVNYVPNAAFRSRVLAASPALKPILDAYPVGQRPLNATTDQINLVASNRVREDAGMIRVDYRFNERSSLYARYNIDDVYRQSLRCVGIAQRGASRAHERRVRLSAHFLAHHHQ
jgi:predicted porin